MKTIQYISYILSAVTGAAIAWIDTLPHWDDTGITAGLLFLSAAGWSIMAQKKPWLCALLTGLWIPLINIASGHQAASLFALVPAFIGAYCGYFMRQGMNQ